MSPQRLVWWRRFEPLVAAAVIARGREAEGLAAATRNRLESGWHLRAAGGSGWLIVLGRSEDLPWADGALYLGWDCGLLLPTTMAIRPGASLIRAALAPAIGELVVVLPDAVIVAAAPARDADPTLLAVM